MYFRRNGMSEVEVKKIRQEGNGIINIKIRNQTQFNRTQNSRYERRYKELCLIRVPEYLRKGKKTIKKLSRNLEL